MRKATGYAVIATAVVNLALLAFLLWQPTAPARRAADPDRFGDKPLAEGVRFTLYVGLNDKDAGGQLVATDAARERLNAVAAEYAGGFTVRHARGYWTNEAGKAEHEETLIYDFLDADAEQVAAIAAHMKMAMNQSAILVERNRTAHIYY